VERLKEVGLAILLTALICLVVVGLFIGVNACRAFIYDDVYRWPKITICRMCDEDIWAWHDYERRKWGHQSGSSGSVTFSSGMSSWFHTECEGVPGVEEVPIKLKINHE